MAEYIDKGTLYEKIAELEELARNRYLDTPSNSPAYPRYMAQMQERTALKHLIADFTVADVAPVRHGYWVGTGDGYADGELVYDMWACSECGFDADGADEKPDWKYCPNCGARMDEEE